MINIAICDDENIIVSQIESILINTCSKKSIPFDIDVFYSGYGLKKEISKGTKYDLIYLDIQMKNCNGITVAEYIRKIDNNVLLVYVSGHEKYMIELFRLDVFAFIKKPIENKNFENVFLEAFKKICSQKVYFTFSYKKEEYKILCIDILYFESIGRKVNVHIKSGNIEKFNGKLSDVEEIVKNGKIPFLRIHQSYLANYHCIKSRSKTEITLIDGTKLPISEDRRTNISQQYCKLLEDEINV